MAIQITQPLKKLAMEYTMTRERFLWYKKEIQRLRTLDNYITDKVRASYKLKKK